MESLNRTAVELVDEAIDFADELGVGVHHLDDNAVVLDFGVETDGGVEAGVLLAEIATGGLATVDARVGELAGAPRLHVELSTDHPLLALLCSGKAAWEFDGGLGSGPARLFAREGDEFAHTDYEEEFDFAVLCVESATLPGEGVAAEVADRTGVPTSGVFLPTAPVASVAGGVATVARAAEVALHRLAHLGYDPSDVLSATGVAPVPPVADDELAAAGRANDALAYGSRVHLVVREDADFSGLPFETTDAHGRRFEELLDGADDLGDLEDVFAPAQVTVDVRGGPTHALGTPDEDRLAGSFGL